MASDGEISCTNDPNFAVIYSFLKVFGKLYGLEVPTISKLQESIENTQEVLDPLRDLHLRLLRRALKSVQSNRWERSLIKFCHQQGNHQEAWEIERFSYKKASTQVKLKVLKLLLEYQFTCHPKFKSAVNALVCKELRLDPIGRDKNGCVYWYQVDDDANLCLYKEDQDEETWQLVARNREELVKVITQLKNGEDVWPLFSNAVHEDSNSNNSADAPAQLELQKQEAEEDNEEEFLSPESESEHEETVLKELSKSPETDKPTIDQNTTVNKTDDNISLDKNATEIVKEEGDDSKNVELIEENEGNSKDQHSKENEELHKKKEESSIKDTELSKDSLDCRTDDVKPIEEDKLLNSEDEGVRKENEEQGEENVDISKENKESVEKIDASYIFNIDEKVTDTVKETESADLDKNKSESCPSAKEVSEAIEEPVLVVAGEGSGADCDSSYIGEEIIEEIMFFHGEGSGYDNDTGNPETIEQAHSPEKNSDAENGNEELHNGEHTHEQTKSNSNNKKVNKAVKLKGTMPAVTKRALKKQPNDTNEVLKSDPKKHCIRNSNKSDSSNSKSTEKKIQPEARVNNKSNTESESPWKSRIKKSRTKVKKKKILTDKSEVNDGKDVKNVTVNCNDSKTSIIEKRKSSVSSVEQEDGENVDTEKEKSPEKDLKVEEPLPPKKLRLESTPESDMNESHSTEKDPLELNNTNVNNESNENKDDKTENDSIAQRKKIKASKGKFKRKKAESDNDTSVLNKSTDKEELVVKEKKVNKSLKRSLLDATMSDENKSESHSESEDDEPVTTGKRLKIRPKKISKSSRKKVEAKLLEKQSTDESEEETLYSIAAGKKASKKVLKKPRAKEQVKGKVKAQNEDSEDSDVAPVRQSRRIAQMKIKEEAERRHLEEVALRELKMIHKKKNKDEEEEWRASGASSSEGEKVKVRKSAAAWRAADSTGPDQDSDSDEPLFEVQHEEPDLDFNNKSDHEFSPESDLESGEPVEPLKRARTLQEGKDDGFCKRCGSGEQPEWILLCDRCDAGYHASCLKPLLLLVPEGDWFCPPCNHDMLINSLESELTKYDELVLRVEEERAKRKEEEPEPTEEGKPVKEKEDDSQSDGSGSSEWSSASSGAVYRLRARKALPVSYRAQEYDRLISSAIKEEYVEPTTSAGNQGRGKDISTIIEAAEERHREAQRDARHQGLPVEMKKFRKKSRRKPRKLNSLEVPSEDDDEIDEDFKDTGLETSSEDISSSAERDSSNESRSSDSLPIRRTGRTDKKDRPKMRESSPEVKKKKKGVLNDTSSESGGTKEWSHKKPKKSRPPKHRDKSSKSHKRSGLTQYDAMGNVIRARVTYGLSPEPNDWSPKHRTRQKKINYTEMPNTESEDEMHKSSGKHMPDSSDEFKVDDSEFDSDSDSDRAKRRKEEAENSDEERRKALSDLIKKTVVVPLEKLPEDVTKAKTEELQAHLDAQAAASTSGVGDGGAGGATAGGAGAGAAGRARGRGRGRGGRGRGRGRPRPHDEDDALAKLVGVKIKDFKADGTPVPANQAEKEKKRQEREAKQAEKEARRQERLQKKEEKEKLKEQKAKEREEKRQARIAQQESKRVKKEKPFFPMGGNMGYGVPVRQMGPEMQRPPMYPNSPVPVRHPGDFQEQQRFPNTPRLQVRAELRGVLTGEDRMQNRQEQPPNAFREGTLSVAGSPQPYKPITEEPSIITRMPHMINQQYRGPMMYPPNNYPPRGQNMGMYPMHPMARQYPAGYNPYLQYRGPMRPPAHGPPASPHGPNTGHGPSPNLGPSPVGPGQPRHLQPTHPNSIRGPPPTAMHRPNHPLSLRPTPPPATPPNPTPTPPISSPNPAPSPSEPFKIKAEVKTEPEYRSPAGSPSPRPPSPEPPRNHPKIKHTENKDRRPRYPLGPYAPQFGPYGPYAPDPTLQRMHQMQYLPNEREDPNLPPPYLRAPRPSFIRASPPFRPSYEPRPYEPRPPYGETRPQYEPRLPFDSTRPTPGEPRSSAPYGDSPRPPGPYSEQTRPPGPYPEGIRPPGPYSESTRPPGTYMDSAGPPGPYTDSPRIPGPYGELIRPPGPFGETIRPSGPYGDATRPQRPYTESPRPSGPYGDSIRQQGPYTDSTKAPGPYTESQRPPRPFAESPRPPVPYGDPTRPPGLYSNLPRPPGPFGDSTRPPGPYGDSTRPPGPYNESPKPPARFTESPRPTVPYTECPRPPGPFSESPRPPGSFSESPRPPGPFSESPRPPGPFSESPRPPGPFSESPRPLGPFSESPRPLGPFSESPRPPGQFSESPRPPGPFAASPRPPGPYTEQARPPGPYVEPTRVPGPYAEPTKSSGPYVEPKGQPGPYEPTRPPGPYTEPTRPPGPFAEQTRPPAAYIEPARPVHPAMRESLETGSSPRSLEERPTSRETPQPEVSNGQVMKSPSPAPPQPYIRPEATPVSLSIKPEPGENDPPREEGSVFGGLVSYFSSQHEDDLDT